MQFQLKNGDISAQKSQCAVALIYADKTLSKGANSLDKTTKGTIKALISNGDINLKAGQAAWIPALKDTNFQRILVVCLGQKKKDEQEKDFISACTTIGQQLASRDIKAASISLDDITVVKRDEAWLAQTLSKAIVVASYRYTETKSKNDKLPSLSKIIIASTNKTAAKSLKLGISHGNAIGVGINAARHLGNLPGNYCTPSDLAARAKNLAAKNPKLTTKIVDEKQMQKLGMGSLLSVTAGTDQPAKLIVMEYKGKASKSPSVLVGKGITFDSGGISLKPGAGMDEMKFDMCGAASVFGVIEALVTMKANVHVIGVVAAAENMPNGNATKPGDVVTSMSGQTIEVLNTDAEGRLVLCDALTYVERFKPKEVIDIATLTGACVVALGNHATGLYANDQDLADQLIEAGNDANDKAWQMPLWDEYKKQLDSNFADLANIGGRTAGSVTAACFLSCFTQNYKWAHLDIAGTAWLSGGNKGATGRPVSLLLNHILNNG